MEATSLAAQGSGLGRPAPSMQAFPGIGDVHSVWAKGLASAMDSENNPASFSAPSSDVDLSKMAMCMDAPLDATWRIPSTLEAARGSFDANSLQRPMHPSIKQLKPMSNPEHNASSGDPDSPWTPKTHDSLFAATMSSPSSDMQPVWGETLEANEQQSMYNANSLVESLLASEKSGVAKAANSQDSWATQQQLQSLPSSGVLPNGLPGAVNRVPSLGQLQLPDQFMLLQQAAKLQQQQHMLQQQQQELEHQQAMQQALFAKQRAAQFPMLNGQAASNVSLAPWLQGQRNDMQSQTQFNNLAVAFNHQQEQLTAAQILGQGQVDDDTVAQLCMYLEGQNNQRRALQGRSVMEQAALMIEHQNGLQRAADAAKLLSLQKQNMQQVMVQAGDMSNMAGMHARGPRQHVVIQQNAFRGVNDADMQQQQRQHAVPKLSSKLVTVAAQAGVQPQTLWNIIRHPLLLDMLVRERDMLRGGPPSSSRSQHAPSSGSETPRKAMTPPLVDPVEAAMISRASMDPAFRKEEYARALRTVVDLLTKTASFLVSSKVKDLMNAVQPIADLYDSMHDLPVVHKRKRCIEMAALRKSLCEQDDGTVRVTVEALAKLRSLVHHHTSRMLLLSDATLEAVPLDILLGCMCNDLITLVKPHVQPGVVETFEAALPSPKLALLVFAEFTTVDPAPAGGKCQ